MVCFAATIPMGFSLRYYYVYENKRRDRLQAEMGEGVETDKGDFSDRSDVENLSFRYAL